MDYQAICGAPVTSLGQLPQLGGSRVVVLVSSEPLLRTDQWEEFLTPFELSRARLLARESNQLRFKRGRHLLRKTLGHYLSMEPGAVPIANKQSGKPVVVGEPDMHFSLSHSDRWLCMAFSRSSPVGIDVELLRHLDEAGRAVMIAEARNRGWIAEPAEGDIDAQLFSFWVTREALIKAAGTSIAADNSISDNTTWCAIRIELGAEVASSLAFQVGRVSEVEVCNLGGPLS